MMRRVVAILAGVALAAPLAQAAREEADGPRTPPTVEQLIADLGSDAYSVRRRAEEHLLRLGPEAFDALKAAEDHEDLEIAERVRYIVHRMRVEWTRPDDGPQVRGLLTRFNDLSEETRRERIDQLAALEDDAGLPALCRIARYDASPLVARRAALAVLAMELSAASRQTAEPACLAELGSSRRAPGEWIRLYLRELDEPAESADGWAEAIDAEAALLTERSLDTDFQAVRTLRQRQLGRARELDLPEHEATALARIVDLIAEQLARCRESRNQEAARATLYALYEWDVEYAEPDVRVAGLAWAVQWAIKHQSWDALAILERDHADALRGDRKLLYLLAAAAGRAARTEQAEELADRAFALPGEDADRRAKIAAEVARLGFISWAEREYRRVIAELPVVDPRSMEARNDLAMWLHDREDHGGAAQTLAEFCDALDADQTAKRRLIEELDTRSSSGRETLGGVIARRWYYQACADEAAGDFAAQQKHLEEAAAAYDKDPDILIAMHRAQGVDAAYRRRTRVRIQRTAQYLQKLIDEYPDYPGFYNQWAWLIANTEGDQDKAVAYSRRSLELAPDEPSYLDTLGRCYYAVGDFDRAVEHQRRAVELAPHFQVMHRQLAQFEAALAERDAAADGDAAP
ncbi:MAG TPA: hypothetical protein PKC18_01870 [Lacipirellulaceae bacterium]|nr:hypothetical protein [Lacipirellulaceae bacterium]